MDWTFEEYLEYVNSLTMQELDDGEYLLRSVRADKKRMN